MRVHSSAQHGFTLIELIIVMAIIATAVALIIPQVSSGEGVKLEAQVRDLVAVLKHARRSAIIEGRPKTILLQQGHAVDRVPLTRLPDRWESRGAALQWAEDSELGSLRVTFFPAGGSSGGTVLMTEYDIQARIDINRLTGKIQVEYVEARD